MSKIYEKDEKNSCQWARDADGPGSRVLLVCVLSSLVVVLLVVGLVKTLAYPSLVGMNYCARLISLARIYAHAHNCKFISSLIRCFRLLQYSINVDFLKHLSLKSDSRFCPFIVDFDILDDFKLKRADLINFKTMQAIVTWISNEVKVITQQRQRILNKNYLGSEVRQLSQLLIDILARLAFANINYSHLRRRFITALVSCFHLP